MFLRSILLLSLGLCPLAKAQETATGNPPSKQVVNRALQWMQSSDPKRRDAAFRSVHLLGKEALPAFRQALRKALRYHERRLADTIKGRNRGGNPYAELVEISEELTKERARVYPRMMKDWQKDKGKIDGLRNDFGALEKLYLKAAKLAEADTTKLDQDIEAITHALIDVHEQIARYDGLSKEEAEEISAEERRQKALEESYDGHEFLKAAKYLGSIRSEVSRLTSADQHNDECDWASKPQQNFAKLISYERTVMGLGPLLLEEKLSDAATGHSEDMRKLGFFDHTSPVEGKRSFVDRARKAGFRGGPSGECIAAGYGNATAVYAGWFYSDGHRHIMLTRGPNVHGIGLSGTHWTLVTGSQ